MANFNTSWAISISFIRTATSNQSRRSVLQPPSPRGLFPSWFIAFFCSESNFVFIYQKRPPLGRTWRRWKPSGTRHLTIRLCTMRTGYHRRSAAIEQWEVSPFRQWTADLTSFLLKSGAVTSPPPKSILLYANCHHWWQLAHNKWWKYVITFISSPFSCEQLKLQMRLLHKKELYFYGFFFFTLSLD